MKGAIEGLQYVLQTKNDIYLLASSGTGGMESAVCNLVSPLDKTIVVEGGKFGERWTELCEAYGVNSKVIKVEWGKAVSPSQIKEILDVVSEKIPGLLKEISGLLYSPKSAKQYAEAAAIFYKELKGAGMTNDQAFELTSQYLSTLNIGKMMGKFGSGRHD